jgi:hypothetical protein
MEGYLGETPVENLDGTPFQGFNKLKWALYYIERFGQYDGGHHKQWVMDQIVRILKGTKVKVTLAKWTNGQQEYRVDTAEPSKTYLKWVEEMKGYNEDTQEYDYDYDEGIAP